MLRIPDNHLEDYLVASLGYSGTDRWHQRPEPDAAPVPVARLLAMGMGAYQRAVGGGYPALPFFLALDLRLLAEFGYEFTYAGGGLAGFDPMLRARYENEILNRLLREHRVQQALELLAFHRARQDNAQEPNQAFDIRAERLAHLLIEQLAPHWPAQLVVNAAHLRGRTLNLDALDHIPRAVGRWNTYRAEREEALPDFDEMLNDFIHSATGSRAGTTPVQWTRVLELQDLFELEHLEALDREYLRLGARHIIDVMTSLPELDPHDIELREEINEVESQFMDDSYYPTGGFSEITNRGSFENLVLSELIYMGEGADLEAPAEPQGRRVGIDLFDLRFVEGELLFYTRDSGQLFRKRRTLRLIIDMHSRLKIKYPHHPYQLATMVTGMVLALVRDLALLFGNDALRFHVQILASDEDADATKLSETLAILLASPIQHNLLDIQIQPELDPWTLGQWKRKTYALIFSANAGAVDTLAAQLDDLLSASPPLFTTLIDLSPRTEANLPQPQDHVIRPDLSTSGIQQLKHDILLDIMASRR